MKAKTEFKTIEELIKEEGTFIDAMPNNLGINLCCVKGIQFVRQDDGQLISMTIIFNPDNEWQ